MLGAEINGIEWVQYSHEGKCKLIAVGNGQGAYAKAKMARGGLAAGDIIGSSGVLLASAMDAPADANKPVKLYCAGEAGELFAHTGTPFKAETGKTIGNVNCFVNGMDYSEEAKVLLIVTGDKRIIAYSGESDEMICEKAAAHTKGIYDVRWITTETFMTCSADNTLKLWKFDAGAKTIEE